VIPAAGNLFLPAVTPQQQHTPWVRDNLTDRSHGDTENLRHRENAIHLLTWHGEEKLVVVAGTQHPGQPIDPRQSGQVRKVPIGRQKGFFDDDPDSALLADVFEVPDHTVALIYDRARQLVLKQMASHRNPRARHGIEAAEALTQLHRPRTCLLVATPGLGEAFPYLITCPECRQRGG
jgi:hypothetical protein